MKSINDLDRWTGNIKEEIKQALLDCVDSGWYILGKNVSSFEEEFACYTGNSNCVSVANGTDALEIGLKALGVKSGDQVITVANAGFYSSIGILACGAEPVYADIDPQSYTMSPESLKKLICKRTKAVILTHLYGRLGDVFAVADLCRSNGIPLLEDCAQAHGARLEGRMAGAFGDISCYSFYPTKNLGAMGDGGALCTSNSILADKIRILRQYGWGKKYYVDSPYGRNSRLDEMQACVLRIKLRYLDQWNKSRRDIAKKYNDGITNSLITRKPIITGEDFVAHLYVLEMINRTSLIAKLKEKAIPCDIHYPIPDHRQLIFGNKYEGIKLTNTECACSLVLTLPCFPEMTIQEIEQVISVVNDWNNE